MTAWLSNGEKYALVGLEVKIDEPIPFRELVPGLWAWTDQRLDVPTHWREWIGSIRAEEIEGCNLVLLSKMPSSTPGVLDAENQLLQRRVWGFYIALLLRSTFTPSHRPIMLTGAHRDGEIDVRQESAIDTPALNLFRHYPPVLPDEIEDAAALACNYERLAASPPAGGAWRIFRALSVYVDARTATDPMDRLQPLARRRAASPVKRSTVATPIPRWAEDPLARPSQAACLRRLAIFAMVARLQPVALWIVFHDWPAAIMLAIPSLRSVSSGRPL